MSDESLPWPEKHRPRKLDGLVGNREAIRALKSWVESWISRVPGKRAALLVGPPGTGKTASVGALANDLDMELVEFNSSDKRNKDSIETLVWRAASQQTLDGRPRLILLDEVDGLSGTSDRGGVGAILKVIKDAVHPIVMTANDPNSPRLKDLMKVCQVYNFEAIENIDIEKILKYILSENNVDVSEEVLDEIVEGSGGDLRAAISDLASCPGGYRQTQEICKNAKRRDGPCRSSTEPNHNRAFGTLQSPTRRVFCPIHCLGISTRHARFRSDLARGQPAIDRE